jgi:hypothetical protein
VINRLGDQVVPRFGAANTGQGFEIIGAAAFPRVPSAHAIYVATLSSLSAPRMTIFSASSGRGRCSPFASSQGARIQTGGQDDGHRLGMERFDNGVG